MSDVTWLIQTNLLATDQIREVWTRAEEAGARCVEAIVIPFVDSVEVPDDLVGNRVIPYGSTKLTKMAILKDWKGVFFSYAMFNMKAFNSNRDDMLNSDAHFTSVDKLKDFDGEDDEVFFIRPVYDLKEFNGTVTTGKEVRKWMSSIASGSFDIAPDAMVTIASPKKIINEARYFIVDKKIISGSYYRIRGQLNSSLISPSIIQHIQEEFVDGKWLPNDVCVMDVALTDDGYKVVEFNGFNSTGFYAHDVGSIVAAVTSHVRKMV